MTTHILPQAWQKRKSRGWRCVLTKLYVQCRCAGPLWWMMEEVFTCSFFCDMMAACLSFSLFSLISSASCCLAAIAASSLATSSCWARHCCNCTHTEIIHTRACKYTQPGKTNKTKNKKTGHYTLAAALERKSSSCVQVPQCQEVAWTFSEVLKLPFSLSVSSPREHLRLSQSLLFEPPTQIKSRLTKWTHTPILMVYCEYSCKSWNTPSNMDSKCVSDGFVMQQWHVGYFKHCILARHQL